MHWSVHMFIHLACSRAMKARIGFRRFMAALDFLPFYEDQTQSDCSCLAGLIELQRWEEVLVMGVFQPRGNAISISQCNYQDKTFSLRGEGQSFLPWCVEIWFDWKGCAAWCVLAGSGASAAHALSLHVHTQWLLNAWLFSLSLNYCSTEEVEKKFHTTAAEVSWKMSNTIKCVLNFELSIPLQPFQS